MASRAVGALKMIKSETRNKIKQTLGILAVVVLFYVALWILRREIRASHYEDVVRYLKQIPANQFLTAFLFSMGSYFALTFYDLLGLKHIQKSIPYLQVALTSFIAYAFSHNISAGALTGGGVRYRLYSLWGITVGETANVLVICVMTFWVGFVTMGAVFFFLEPPELPPSIHLHFDSTFSIGIACIVLITAYLLTAIFIKKTIKIWRWKFPTPSLGIVLGQMAAGCLEWTCSGTCLYMLLPPNSLSLTSFLAIYLLMQLAGYASQVPGGLGVLETVGVLLLSPMLPASDVLGALLAFRAIYYLIPFALGLIAFAVYEIIRNQEGFKRALQILNRWAPEFLPHVYAIVVFASGAMLLFSDASPEVVRRTIWLNEFLPISFLEGSHFAVAIIGALLLVLARSLQRRVESGYYLVLVLLGLGVLGSFFKGFDYQEALILLVIFAALLFSRGYFPRKGSIFQQSFPAVWIAAVLSVWLGSLWVGVFNYRYEDYSNELWTTFDLMQDVARFFRASLGATVTLFIFSIVCLLSPAAPETEFPNASELDKAEGILRNSPKAFAALSLLGDKALIFNKRSDALIMYAIEGKSWIAMGDAVGHEKEAEDLALKFRDLCLRKKAMPLFYLVDQKYFQFYLDMGLTVLKIGEEARVPLKSFGVKDLHADLKNTYQRFKDKEDYAFDVIPAEGVEPHLKEIRDVSESWLSKHKAREKGFSGGFFHPGYLKRSSLAVIRKEGKIMAFANLLQGHGKEEAAVDILRSTEEATKALEDHLTLEIMLWAKEKGIQWFNLGPAGLLDMAESPLAPFEVQMTEILSPYVRVSNLMEIRKDKERFNPEWNPKYLASSGNLSLDVAFNNIRSLISRGNRAGSNR